MYKNLISQPPNFIYGREKAKGRRHVTFMPVLLRPTKKVLGQVIGSASEGKYNTVNNNTSGEVTYQKYLNSGITYFYLKLTTVKKHSPRGVVQGTKVGISKQLMATRNTTPNGSHLFDVPGRLSWRLPNTAKTVPVCFRGDYNL